MLAQLAAEANEAEGTAEVDLESLGMVAVLVVDQLAFEPDVGDLAARTRVGAAVVFTVIGTSSASLMSASRCSSLGTSAWLRLRVSVKESLQNSMPLQAIRLRRQFDGRPCRPTLPSLGDQTVDLVVGDVEHDQLLVRAEPMRSEPTSSAASATFCRMVPEIAFAMGSGSAQRR